MVRQRQKGNMEDRAVQSGKFSWLEWEGPEVQVEPDAGCYWWGYTSCQQPQGKSENAGSLALSRLPTAPRICRCKTSSTELPYSQHILFSGRKVISTSNERSSVMFWIRVAISEQVSDFSILAPHSWGDHLVPKLPMAMRMGPRLLSFEQQSYASPTLQGSIIFTCS